MTASCQHGAPWWRDDCPSCLGYAEPPTSAFSDAFWAEMERRWAERDRLVSGFMVCDWPGYSVALEGVRYDP